MRVAPGGFPMFGKHDARISNHWKILVKNFQSLEESAPEFPMFGRIRAESSNHWKNVLKMCQSGFAKATP
jgi:hypothetical protein